MKLDRCWLLAVVLLFSQPVIGDAVILLAPMIAFTDVLFMSPLIIALEVNENVPSQLRTN
jgi:hypothetical protein